MSKKISVDDLKVGDVLYDVHTERAGNTTMRREGVWTAIVREVGVTEEGTPYALISWNGNPPKRHLRTTSYTRWPKEWIRPDPWDMARGGGRYCGVCYGRENKGGHLETCEHPRAAAARKRAAKEHRQ